MGLAALASLSPVAAARAEAQQVSVLSIPAGRLEDALISLARQTGASIGLPGKLPHIRTRAISGRITAAQALDNLLSGTGYRAIPVGPNTWRIVAAPLPPRQTPARQSRRPIPPNPSAAPYPPPPLPDIVVTAAKRTEPLETTPIDSAVISGATLERYSALPSTGAVAAADTGLALSNLGPGRNRAYLRGVSDSPFNGQTQSTVATLLDDARVTFNAPDPDLYLVDVERVELLKGPQGPLYGTGAIGGVFRIATNKPRMDRVEASLSATAQALAHGGKGVGGAAILNLPIQEDRLAVRAVAYGAREPGWIDNGLAGGDNSNRTQMHGARLALRWRPDPDWTVDLAGAMQMLHVNDSQYVTGLSTRERSGIAPEPHDNDFGNARLSVTGRIGTVDLFSTTSWTAHEVDSRFDATASAALFGLTGPVIFEDDRLYHVFNQEVRASGRSGSLRWMAGGSFLAAMTHLDASLDDTNGGPQTIGTLNQTARELAAFGDIGLDVTRSITIEAGARLFASRIHEDKGAASPATALRTRRTGVSPSLAISFKPDSSSYYYLRAASAFRPAGLNPFTPTQTEDFGSDELTTVELGGRWHTTDRNFSAQTVLYGSQWVDIQSDYLLPNGLVATRNSGRGMVYGIEASAKWRLDDAWSLGGAANYQHARLEKPAPGLAVAGDRQLPVVPAYRATLDITHNHSIGSWNAAFSAHLSLVGPARLSLDPGLDRRVGAYTTVDLATTAHRGGWSWGLSVQNLLNSDHDTFSFGNPFSIRTTNQHVPLRPRSVSVRLGWALP